MPELRRKDGKLSAYGFACGYIDRFFDTDEWVSSTVSVEIYMEHSHYHVRTFDHVLRDAGASSEWNTAGSWRTWVTFDGNELSLARKEYAKEKARIKVLIKERGGMNENNIQTNPV